MVRGVWMPVRKVDVGCWIVCPLSVLHQPNQHPGTLHQPPLKFMSNDLSVKNHLSVVVIVSLIFGTFAGACGSFFLQPRLAQTEWGRQFLGNEVVQQATGQTKVYEVTEDSATIDVVKKVSPSVVSVVVTKELSNFYNMTGPDIFGFPFQIVQPQPSQEKQKQEVGGGTGFVIAADGLILTNKHVVADDKAEYSVVFNDGKKYEAKVL